VFRVSAVAAGPSRCPVVPAQLVAELVTIASAGVHGPHTGHSRGLRDGSPSSQRDVTARAGIGRSARNPGGLCSQRTAVMSGSPAVNYP
jgi:hypothetical protein